MMEHFSAVFWFRLFQVVSFWGGVIAVAIFYNMKEDNDFSLIELVMEGPKGHHRPSMWNVVIVVTWGLSAMIMTGWYLNETLLWTDFLSFLGVWITPLIVKMFAPKGP
jgi:hypothetical protein